MCCRPEEEDHLETLAEFVNRYRISAIWLVGAWMVLVVLLLAYGPVLP
jgi:hypothetical protein